MNKNTEFIQGPPVALLAHKTLFRRSFTVAVGDKLYLQLHSFASPVHFEAHANAELTV
jgi:hypothetical protein